MRGGVVMAVLVSVLLVSAAGALGGIAVAKPALKPEPKGGDGATIQVKIGDNYFRPKKVEIVAGTTLRWTNRGRNEHDIIPNKKGEAFGIDELEPDEVYSFRFTEPGKYAYYCSFHGVPGVGQHATVKVVELLPPVPTTRGS